MLCLQKLARCQAQGGIIRGKTKTFYCVDSAYSFCRVLFLALPG